jgi:hypothetical protein
MHPFFLFHWQDSLLLFYEAPLLGHIMC